MPTDDILMSQSQPSSPKPHALLMVSLAPTRQKLCTPRDLDAPGLDVVWHRFSGTRRAKNIDITRCILMRYRDTRASCRDLSAMLCAALLYACEARASPLLQRGGDAATVGYVIPASTLFR